MSKIHLAFCGFELVCVGNVLCDNTIGLISIAEVEFNDKERTKLPNKTLSSCWISTLTLSSIQMLKNYKSY
jgi:hypothetical protein